MRPSGQLRRRRVPALILLIGDVAVTNAAFLLAFAVRFDWPLPTVNLDGYRGIALPATMVGIVLLWLLDLYSPGRRQAWPDVVIGSLLAVPMVGGAAAMSSYLGHFFAFPRTVLVIGTAFLAVLLPAWRYFCWRLDGDSNILRRFIGIVSPGRERDLVPQLIRLSEDTSVPFLLDRLLKPDDGSSFVQDIAKADGVVVDAAIDRATKTELIVACLEQGLDVHLSPEFYEILISRVEAWQIADKTLLKILPLRPGTAQRQFKRILEVSVSGLLLLAALPLMAATALLIKLDSGGPVLYAQERVGEGGRTFTLLKFRTMQHNAEEATGPVLAVANDGRVTGVGRLLRPLRLDELPQLFNVLKGDMSLVGPRPERPEFVARHERENPYYRCRHLVKPGITGLAQVMAKYNSNVQDKLYYDLVYIRHYSVLLDGKILLQTIPVLFKPETATGVEGLRRIPCDSAQRAYSGDG